MIPPQQLCVIQRPVKSSISGMRPPPASAPTGRNSRIEQNARVEHALRVERLLGRPQRRSKESRDFSVVPRPVIAANSMMMGDGAAGADQRVARGALDRPPLVQQSAVPAEGMETKV